MATTSRPQSSAGLPQPALPRLDGALQRQLPSYFFIFASVIVALLILCLMFEHMGYPAGQIAMALLLLPIGLYCLIGLAAYCSAPLDFFAAGRSVTGVFAALGASVGLLGGCGIVALSGAFFFLGFDALPYLIGTCLGLLIATVLLIPYVRKDGAYTLAGFLGRRFESRMLRVQAAIGLSLPALLLLIAELKLGGFIAARTLGLPPMAAVAALAGAATITVIAGGARSLTWASVAQGLVALFALLVPITIVAVMTTTLPAPQLSYGRLADDITVLEQVARFANRTAQPMMLTLPGSTPETIVKPFFQPFGSMGRVGFALLMLTVAFGVAALPLLAMRATSSVSVRESRRMSIWTMLFCGLILVTLPAIAAFARFVVLTDLPGATADQLPAWLTRLTALDLARFDAQAGALATGSVRYARDGVLLLLPIAGNLPASFVTLAALGALSAILAAIGTQILTLASMWSEDVLFAWGEPGAHPTLHVNATRLFCLLTAIMGSWLAVTVQADPLTLFNWALAIGASTAFPLLVMSVWWKRINHWGAMAGMAAGNLTALLHIILTLAGTLPPIFGLNGTLSAALGVPIGALVAFIVSLATPQPQKRVVDLVRDIRVPGGETVYDRDLRLVKRGAST
jgi:cation/acetate symporter